MTSQSWAFAEDVGAGWVAVGGALLLVAFGLLLGELRRRERGGVAILATGLLALVALAGAALRPVTVQERGIEVGPRVVVLVDGSRRLELPGDGGGTRRATAERVVTRLRERLAGARLSLLEFGDGELRPYLPGAEPGAERSDWVDSDLVAALRSLGEERAELPRAVVVVSDGRLARPGEAVVEEALRAVPGLAEVPLHTVAIATRTPPDASVLRVETAGAVVAHQAFELHLEVACVGGLRCGAIPVRVRELRLGADPSVLARGQAEVEGETARLSLPVTLERAGARVLEIAIEPPAGDSIAANDRRYLALDVARDRIRLLHVAGRPGYDARALRMWLKQDESVDLVAFFILRSDFDDVQASDADLSLIRFPVDELFTQHLSSFDAVILQNIDAVAYKLARHLPALAGYVEQGGGLILVGGESSFGGGQYAGTALERVLPVGIPTGRQHHDAGDFVPRYSSIGRVAPSLRGLRDLLGDELPELPGANLLGAARPQAIVLWEHPILLAGDAPMPVLAMGEAGDGRAIALGVDGTHRLAFGRLAAEVGGRGYGALWDGLLGWLMRDPRYEPARIRLAQRCVAGRPLRLDVVPMPGGQGEISLSVERLGAAAREPQTVRAASSGSGTVSLTMPPVEPGGFVARATVGQAPEMRFDFACELGGPAWSDVRPDRARLERIARVTGGVAVGAQELARLPRPASVRIAAERSVTPWLPPWAWSLVAATALGLHWLLRRIAGLA